MSKIHSFVRSLPRHRLWLEIYLQTEKLDGWVKQLANPEYDWSFPIVPQKHAGNNTIFWSR